MNDSSAILSLLTGLKLNSLALTLSSCFLKRKHTNKNANIATPKRIIANIRIIVWESLWERFS
jgi:hypothetical protein